MSNVVRQLTVMMMVKVVVMSVMTVTVAVQLHRITEALLSI